MTVTQDACISQATTQIVEVDAPLAEANITCSSTTESVTFMWDAVPGATGYIVNNVPQTELTITIDGLAMNETVNIEVVAVGTGACGNSISLSNCTASNCPPLAINFEPVDDYCEDPANQPTDIEVIGITGGTFTGPGITDPIAGIFDPNDPSAVVGANIILFEFSEAGCDYSETITINVNPLPTINAGTAPQEISCTQETVTLLSLIHI